MLISSRLFQPMTTSALTARSLTMLTLSNPAQNLQSPVYGDRSLFVVQMRMILEAGRYSPTGGNSQSVSFTILGSRQNEAEKLCVDLFRKGQRAGSSVLPFLKRVEISDTFFFKGAPLVIVVSERGSVDAGLASSYMEIMAESLGLGVLYSGFFITCTKISRKLRSLIRLPKGQKAVTCMIIGYPAVKYRRIVPRKELKARIL